MIRNNDNQYIEPDNTYYEPSRDFSQGTLALVVIVTTLFLILTTVLAVVFFREKFTGKRREEDNPDISQNSGFVVIATPTPTPIPPLSSNQNPNLYPASEIEDVTIDEVVSEVNPNNRGLTQTILSGDNIITDYVRTNPISFGDPLYYANVPGIFTYRGNNFRNCASFGYTTVGAEPGLEQIWEFSEIGKRLASTQTFEWTGVSYTGQPLVIQWDSTVRNDMTMLYPDKRTKDGFTEVIVAGLDGKVYFFDIDDGSPSRIPLYVGCSIKGTAALDPRGYPLLYLGQGDDNADDEQFGMYIYSLIDGSQNRIYSYNAKKDSSYRTNWSAFDSSPLIDSNSDTLIWPCENGLIYTFELNTEYTPGSGTIRVSPNVVGLKYIYADENGSHMGVESSIAVYDEYGYFTDNDCNLNCIDLNSMQLKWTLRLDDDTDITPVIDVETVYDDKDHAEHNHPFVYVGTEVDNQIEAGSQGCSSSYIYKIDGLTGEIIWQNSEPCYSYNGETSDTDQSGGCFGNIIVGKRSISNLVIFSFSMTNGVMSGNKLVAYNKDTGTKAWSIDDGNGGTTYSYNMNIYSYSSPVDCYDESGRAYIVIGDSVGQIHLVDASTGKRLKYIQTSRFLNSASETTNGIIFEASPVVYNNTIIICSKSGSVFAIKIL